MMIYILIIILHYVFIPGDDYTLNNGSDTVNLTLTSQNNEPACFVVVLQDDDIVDGNDEVFILRIRSIVVSSSVCESVLDIDTSATAEVIAAEGDDGN